MPGGLRHNKGKRRVDLIDVEALNGVAEVLEAGAAKYAERNWEAGMAWSKAYASLLRHAYAFWNGEDLDPESGLPHVDHLACNAMFLQAYWRRNRDDDDRPRKRGSTPVGAVESGEEGEATPLSESTKIPQEEPGIVYQVYGASASWVPLSLPVASRGFYESLLDAPAQRVLRNAQDYEE